MPLAWWRQVFGETPRIAVLLQTMHHIVGDTKSFILIEALP
jgi:hypothetical protein